LPNLLNQIHTCLTKLHGVTRKETVTFSHCIILRYVQTPECRSTQVTSTGFTPNNTNDKVHVTRHSAAFLKPIYFVCVLEMHGTVSCTEIFGEEQQRFYGQIFGAGKK